MKLLSFVRKPPHPGPLPRGGEGAPVAHLASLSPRRGEGQGEGCLQQLQQLRLGRGVLRLARRLNPLQAVFDARLRVVDPRDERATGAGVAEQRGETTGLVGQRGIGDEPGEDGFERNGRWRGLAFEGVDEAIERGVGERGLGRDGAEKFHRGVQMFCAGTGVGEIADASHHAACAVSGNRVIVRAE